MRDSSGTHFRIFTMHLMLCFKLGAVAQLACYEQSKRLTQAKLKQTSSGANYYVASLCCRFTVVSPVVTRPLIAFPPQCFWSTFSQAKLSEALCCWSDCVTRGKPLFSAGWDGLKASLSALGCSADLILICMSCFGSCCLESSSAHRPPSLTAVLRTKRKMTGWVKVVVCHYVVLLIVSNRCPPPSRAQGSTWTLIDLPGHDSLRPQYLEKFKSAARWEQDTLSSDTNALPDCYYLLISYFPRHLSLPRAIVFVVDSAIFQKEVRDVAEFLYVLLTDTVICRNAPALIVACNKQGATTSLQWNKPVIEMLSLLSAYFKSFLSVMKHH